jgi:ribose/xylose/arabinose/galactoside ABC-type transport system permease subunit
MLAALAGLVYLGRLGAAEAEIGNAFHFQCVSAVAIGGISFAGGAGSAWGAVIGALILNILLNGMNLLNISSYWQGTVNGIVIIVAVLLDYVVRKQKGK